MDGRRSRLFGALIAVSIVAASVMGGVGASATTNPLAVPHAHAVVPAVAVAGTYQATFSGQWPDSQLVIHPGPVSPDGGTFELTDIGDYGDWVVSGNTIALQVASSVSGHAGSVLIGHVSNTGIVGQLGVIGLGQVGWAATPAGASARAVAPSASPRTGAAGTYAVIFPGLTITDTLTLTADTSSVLQGSFNFASLATGGTWVQMGKHVALGISYGNDAGIVMLGVHSAAGIGSAAVPAIYDQPGLGVFPWYGTTLATPPPLPLADAIVVNDGGVTVRRSTGTAFGPNETWTTTPFGGSRGTFFADVDGDGKADAIAVGDNGVSVALSNGTAFGTPTAWTSSAYYGQIGTFFADVNGDGKADAVVVNFNGIFVKLSTGTGFGPTTTWSGLFAGFLGTFFADVNGDGKADAIAVNPNGITVRLSTGSGFGSPQTWMSGFYSTRGTYLADVNGDGKADVISDGTTGIVVRLSTGTAFGAPQNWTTDVYYGDHGTAFADVNGDGKADAIAVGDNGVSVRPSTGTAFGPTQAWTSGAYYGTHGTFFANVG
jgi:FG-GAP-like repeat